MTMLVVTFRSGVVSAEPRSAAEILQVLWLINIELLFKVPCEEIFAIGKEFCEDKNHLTNEPFDH